jgi:putative peptide zinc metalloprotease protein
MTLLRRLSTVVAAVAVATCAAWSSPATAGADTSAVAINTKDGSSVFRLAFSVRKVMSDVVDQQNAAVAYSSCESCQTVAISIQVLLVASDPEVLEPTNLAIAINDACTLCQTLASAYQFVIGTGERLTLTGEGRQELQRIRKSLQELGKSGLSIDDIQTRTDALMDDLRHVLATQLVLKKPGPDQDEAPATSTTPNNAGLDQQGAQQQTEPSPTATTPSPESTTPTSPPAPEDSSSTTIPQQ